MAVVVPLDVHVHLALLLVHEGEVALRLLVHGYLGLGAGVGARLAEGTGDAFCVVVLLAGRLLLGVYAAVLGARLALVHLRYQLHQVHQYFIFLGDVVEGAPVLAGQVLLDASSSDKPVVPGLLPPHLQVRDVPPV